MPSYIWDGCRFQSGRPIWIIQIRTMEEVVEGPKDKKPTRAKPLPNWHSCDCWPSDFSSELVRVVLVARLYCDWKGVHLWLWIQERALEFATMGFTQIPEQAQRGRNKAVLSLDKNELTQTINVLQKVVTHLNSNPNALPKFPSHPPSVIPDFLTTRRQSSISPVTVITPSVAALQQRLGLDLGSGLGLGPVGTFSTESTRYNDNGSISSPFSSSSSMLAIPPIGPPSGSSRPGPIGRPRSPLNTNSMQGPLPGLQSQFGQLGFRSGEHGSGDLGTRGLDVGSLSLGHTGLPPVRVSTGQVGSLLFSYTRDMCPASPSRRYWSARLWLSFTCSAPSTVCNSCDFLFFPLVLKIECWVLQWIGVMNTTEYIRTWRVRYHEVGEVVCSGGYHDQ